MRIVLPGGTGQIGTLLARAFHDQGHAVTVLSRHPRPAPWNVVAWDGATPGPWTETLNGADVVINLAGRSVNCRYHAAHRRDILQSRVESTRVLGQALQTVPQPPRVWLQSSTATIYAHRYDAPNDEATGILGSREDPVPDTWNFSIDVAQAWERTARETAPPATRLVLLRSAMVMSPDPGGVFDYLLGLVRWGLGGTVGDGRQFMSWIHAADFVRAIAWLIEQDHVSGPVNLAAPQPLPQREFMRALRQAWGARVGLPAPRWLLEIGTFVLRTESELILKSRRVIPGRLLAEGFRFDYDNWPAAATDLCLRWREGHRNRRPTAAPTAAGV